jgi:hypothetical protein
LLLLLQVIQALIAASTADLLAVAFNLATAAHAQAASDWCTTIHIGLLITYIKDDVLEASPHEAGAAEAMLRLFIQLCRRPHPPRAAATQLEVHERLGSLWFALCGMPGAKKLPAGIIVELVELVLLVAWLTWQ